MRQLGAYEIDIDTEKGWVKFALFAPVELDFEWIADVTESANYKPRTIEVALTGDVVPRPGGFVLRLPGTGQEIPLRGADAARERALVRGEVADWKAEPVVMEVVAVGE